MGSEELRQRMRLLDNEIRIMRSDQDRIRHESSTQVNQYLPWKMRLRGGDSSTSQLFVLPVRLLWRKREAHAQPEEDGTN